MSTAWSLTALWHSLVITYLVFSILDFDAAHSDGQNDGLWLRGSVLYNVVLLTATGKIALETHNWTVVTHLAYWGSIAIWYTLLTGISFLPEFAPEMYVFEGTFARVLPLDGLMYVFRWPRIGTW